MKYLTLLRGINVGGNNIIKMAELKLAFERMGFTDVSSFIQSGNIIFSSSVTNTKSLIKKIEAALSKQFNYKSRVLVISQKQLQQAVAGAPKGFGSKPKLFRYDVIFLFPTLSAAKVIKDISLKEGVDKAYSGKEVLYFSRLIAKASQSRLTKIVTSPIYKEVTIRNWNSTTKLLTLMKP